MAIKSEVRCGGCGSLWGIYEQNIDELQLIECPVCTSEPPMED